MRDEKTGPVAAASRETAYAPDLVLITVQGAMLKPRSGEPWDRREAKVAVRPIVSLLAAFVDPAMGMIAGKLANLLPQGAGEDDTLPDPFVTATLHEAVASRRIASATAVNSTHPNWDYSFYAKLSELREAGIDLTVLDNDGGDSNDRIGGLHLPLSELRKVPASGKLVDLKTEDDELESLHVRIEPVAMEVDARNQYFDVPLNEGLLVTGMRVPEGTLVSVQVTGAGRIGNGGLFGCTPDVSPSGLPGGECRNHNLRHAGLEEAPHGSALALVGLGDALQAVSLVDASECMESAAPSGGALAFGINDGDFRNDSGTFHFRVRIEPPTARAKGCSRRAEGALVATRNRGL